MKRPNTPIELLVDQACGITEYDDDLEPTLESVATRFKITPEELKGHIDDTLDEVGATVILHAMQYHLPHKKAEWCRTFPPDFIQELFRLNGWTFKDVTEDQIKRVAEMIDVIVFQRLDPKTLKEMGID